METELLKIFDENRNEIGTASRADAHRKGLWHETFHCWFVERQAGEDYIYLQIRSHLKKDYPSLLDITAAGHLLASETVKDGIREVQEELGVPIEWKEVVSLGIVKNEIYQKNLIDKEYSHIFLYENRLPMEDFRLQSEEVTGIVRAKFSEFESFYMNEVSEIKIEGFEYDSKGQRLSIKQNVGMDRFVPHQESYSSAIVKMIGEYLASRDK
ncbi:Isopentenyldiphosphate isomerase [Bacillus sp. cl95]|nr:NUDIX domain-containing protein [Bacillus sp. UNCCL13]SFA70813.1 Isopentenyldiphosphate isomerase [Bacillus sp. UNCCL13]SFQ60790.1 Isopentenyldiphosphate isomerase [Bacillus sp. cl95]